MEMKNNFSRITAKVTMFLCFSGMTYPTYALSLNVENSCKFFAKEVSEFAQLLDDLNAVIDSARKRNDNATIKKYTPLKSQYIEHHLNLNYDVSKSMEEKSPDSIDIKVSNAISRSVYSDAQLLAATPPFGKSKLTYERMLYQDCISVGVKSENEFNNSPAQIQRTEEMNRLQREMNKPTQQPQQQNITVNPSRPLNCTSMPDGPGSTRMITTCF
jgi:hypothetical protein